MFLTNGLRAVWDEEKVWKQITMTVISLSVYLNSVSKMLSFIPYIFYHTLTKYGGYLCLQRFVAEQECERSLFSFHELPWAEGFLPM